MSETNSILNYLKSIFISKAKNDVKTSKEIFNSFSQIQKKLDVSGEKFLMLMIYKHLDQISEYLNDKSNSLQDIDNQQDKIQLLIYDSISYLLCLNETIFDEKEGKEEKPNNSSIKLRTESGAHPSVAKLAEQIKTNIRKEVKSTTTAIASKQEKNNPYEPIKKVNTNVENSENDVKGFTKGMKIYEKDFSFRDFKSGILRITHNLNTWNPNISVLLTKRKIDKNKESIVIVDITNLFLPINPVNSNTIVLKKQIFMNKSERIPWNELSAMKIKVSV